MDLTEAEGTSATEERHLAVFSFAVEGDLRFISHHDMLRMFRRAFARSGLALRFSEGFNPHPRLRMPLPRPVGVASRAELLVVEFSTAAVPDEAHRALARQMPEGISISDVRLAELGERFLPGEVDYQLEAGDDAPEDLKENIHHLLESEVAEVRRANPKTGSVRVKDVRPYLVSISLSGRSVEFTLRVTGSGTAKPAEIAALVGYDAGSINHRIRRMEVRWQ